MLGIEKQPRHIQGAYKFHLGIVGIGILMLIAGSLIFSFSSVPPPSPPPNVGAVLLVLFGALFCLTSGLALSDDFPVL